MLCDDLDSRDGREVPEGGDVCTLRADSCCCTVESNTTLQSSYPPIKNKFKKAFSVDLSAEQNSLYQNFLVTKELIIHLIHT